MPSQVNVHHTKGKAARIGKALVLVLVALLGLLVLPLGGLILIGLGGYIGMQAHRTRALPTAGPAPGDQAAAPARRLFGLTPSYGLSAACAMIGILVFIAGVAVFSSSAPPQDQAAPAPALPDTVAQPPASPQPVLAQPSVQSVPVPVPASRQAQPSKAPEKPVQPKPVVSQPIAPRSPAAAQPAAPQPVTPKPAAPKPAAPQPDSGSGGGGAPYYKNCAEARAAGAAPLRRGDPGYREELDGDKDGDACETR